MDIKIEKGIPMTRARATTLLTDLPLSDMEVGDSIFVDDAMGNRCQLSALAGQASRQLRPKAFAGRRSAKGGVPSGVRIWRTA